MPSQRLILGLVLALALTPALANAAGDSGGSDDQIPKIDPTYLAAEKAVKAANYQGAIALLNKVVGADPKSANALNYLGYSYCKLGNLDRALGYYQQALKLVPDHRGAHEYLGELYPQMKDLARAQRHLDRLDDICTFGCEEFTDLKKSIQAYKAKHTG